MMDQEKYIATRNKLVDEQKWSDVALLEFERQRHLPEAQVLCSCGNLFASHATVLPRAKDALVSEKPCPRCEKTEGHHRAYRPNPASSK